MGGTVQRPLLAPLVSAVAGEMQGLPPEEFLRDTTKLSNAIRDVVRSLNVDVAVAEFGTLWDAEAMGLPLDWSSGFPPEPKGDLPVPPSGDLANSGRGPVVIEAVRRLSALLGDRVVVSAGVTGPVRFSRLSGGKFSPVEAAEVVLPAVRLLCEAGARLIWVVEDEALPEDPDALASAMAPVWGSIAFYGGAGALHVTGSADGWKEFVVQGGPHITCFDPERSPELAIRFRDSGSFGLALPPGESPPVARELILTKRCFLLTNDGELSGRVAARDLHTTVSVLRSMAQF
ncbi:uroporphyrinogen decarboxylase family protein [Rubrobacter xylanophilus]|nr:uroporphyrinogen decarboxylase family protein [Rubrobacter xylanophilus]